LIPGLSLFFFLPFSFLLLALQKRAFITGKA